MEFNDSRSKKNEEYWSYLKENRREVSKWPTWMRGEEAFRAQECASPSEQKAEDKSEEDLNENPQNS
jgi:hypothetical protein